jgi:hypothetical protein
MSKVTLGGDRLGAGKKQTVDLKNYERSTHDLGYVWRSTMASGTLVPFMSEVALPGDNFDIDLNVDIMTHPTIGPLFGSYKVQLDVFQCPVRLYNGKLHMNMLNIGMDMSQIKLPQITLAVDGIYGDKQAADNDQINPSSIFSYLNIRGLGMPQFGGDPADISRKFNAIPYLAYWDIYKNYYSNKQEEIGAVIHNDQTANTATINYFFLHQSNTNYITLTSTPTNTPQPFTLTNEGFMDVVMSSSADANPDEIKIRIGNQILPVSDIFTEFNIISSTTYRGTNPKEEFQGLEFYYYYVYEPAELQEKPQIVTFPLANIDTMREEILSNVFDPNAFDINASSNAPYGLPIKKGTNGKWCKTSPQEGLGLKTYQSDLFNNWISTEWIDGENGVNAITAVDTSEGSFTIDSLQLSKKVYDMLNRIAVSGGSYDDWLDAVYTHERTRSVENPMYMGGLIKELVFQEVVSTTASTVENDIQPLGTLAGRGKLSGKHKGGKINIKVHEPSYIIGIVSLTPRIDYSQGNKWDVNLKTMDDFHKPALDEIGFQDLYTDQLAWWDTEINNTTDEITFKSAGKQPAWINYMTNVNQVRGNFAEQTQQMWMTLNRRYENGIGNQIEDLTTYIDPSKFNHIFADARLDAQNFWTQIGVNIIARRKMSAKLMPNL